MAFVEQTGAVDKVENVLYSARDSVKFQIVAAHQAPKVIENWGVGIFGIEIHKGKRELLHTVLLSKLREGYRDAPRPGGVQHDLR